MSSRVREIATNEATMRIGANGNFYVFSRLREPVVKTAAAIGRSESGVYWSHLGVWALRVKNRRQQILLKGLFERQGGQSTLFDAEGDANLCTMHRSGGWSPDFTTDGSG